MLSLEKVNGEFDGKLAIYVYFGKWSQFHVWSKWPKIKFRLIYDKNFK